MQPMPPANTRLRILRAARRVLARDRSSAFSTRAIAREAGLSLGAVQHCYARRAALLAATVEFVSAEYADAYAAHGAHLLPGAPGRLERSIDWLVTELRRAPTARLLLTIRSLAGHDRNAARLLERGQAQFVQHLASLVAAARPALGERECGVRAAQLAALLAGISLVAALPGQRHMPALKVPAIRRLIVLVLGPGLGLRQSRRPARLNRRRG
jgi:AcrR family transcriptional regulator